VISDTLPSQFTFVSGSSGCSFDSGTRVVTCTVGALTAGQNNLADDHCHPQTRRASRITPLPCPVRQTMSIQKTTLPQLGCW
jgi:hypothetical protein